MFYGSFRAASVQQDINVTFEKFISLKNAFFIYLFIYLWLPLHGYIPQWSPGPVVKVCAVSLKIFRRCKTTGSMLDMVDSSSLLYRLEMEGKEERRLANHSRVHEDTEGGGSPSARCCIRQRRGRRKLLEDQGSAWMWCCNIGQCVASRMEIF